GLGEELRRVLDQRELRRSELAVMVVHHLPVTVHRLRPPRSLATRWSHREEEPDRTRPAVRPAGGFSERHSQPTPPHPHDPATHALSVMAGHRLRPPTSTPAARSARWIPARSSAARAAAARSRTHNSAVPSPACWRHPSARNPRRTVSSRRLSENITA